MCGSPAARRAAARSAPSSVRRSNAMSATCSRGEAGAAGAAMIAAVAIGLYPDMAACADDWVRPYLNEAHAAGCRAGGALCTDVSGLSRRAARVATALEAARRAACGSRSCLGPSPSSATASCCRRSSPIGSRRPAAMASTSGRSNSPGRTSRWSTAMPARRSTGSRNIWAIRMRSQPSSVMRRCS